VQAVTAEARAAGAAATSEARRIAADATIRQLMVSDTQAALAVGNVDLARALALAALHADLGLAQAESLLAQTALAPGTRRRLMGHSDAVWAVAFSPDGKTLVSGSSDRTLRVWDVASGQSLRTLQGHSGAVGAVAFSPDGKSVVSGSFDNTLRVWPILRMDDLIAWTLANRYVPELTEEQRQRYGLAPLATPTAATPTPAR
jgi:hypothetical protein